MYREGIMIVTLLMWYCDRKQFDDKVLAEGTVLKCPEPSNGFKKILSVFMILLSICGPNASTKAIEPMLRFSQDLYFR